MSSTDVTLSDSILYPTEGGEIIHYTVDVSSDLDFPVDLTVSLPDGATGQGTLALYDPVTGTYGPFSEDLLLSLDGSTTSEIPIPCYSCSCLPLLLVARVVSHTLV